MQPTATTIYALATPPGHGGVAVLRLSGAESFAALYALTRAPIPEWRKMARRDFYHPLSGELLDKGMAVVFAAPNSFTGEDVVELHLHGGRAVIAAMLDACAALPMLRLAERGEFTRRGFDQGKLDLTAAEAVGDLVAAETPAQLRQALRQLGGNLARQTEDWAAGLTRQLAWIEAAIDFAEDEVPSAVLAKAAAETDHILAAMRTALAAAERGERVRHGVRVALVGEPNVGKSSLLNWLAGRDVAIVTPIAGTTRDVVELQLNLAGYAVQLWDMAGLRESHDLVEQIGIERARARAADADLRIFIAAADQPMPAEIASLAQPGDLHITNKVDLAPGMAGISLHQQIGLEEFLSDLTNRVAALCTGDDVLLTRARHRAAVDDAVAALERAQLAPLPELRAEDMRLAVRALGRITGRVDVEDLLDIIFRDFCIGK